MKLFSTLKIPCSFGCLRGNSPGSVFQEVRTEGLQVAPKSANGSCFQREELQDGKITRWSPGHSGSLCPALLARGFIDALFCLERPPAFPGASGIQDLIISPLVLAFLPGPDRDAEQEAKQGIFSWLLILTALPT